MPIDSGRNSGTDEHALAYYPERSDAVTRIVETAAREAVDAIGLKVGEGVALEVALKAFPVDVYPAGWKGMNYLGYGRIETVLRSPEGREIARRRHLFGQWTTSSKNQKRVIADIYARAVWEAVAEALVAQLHPEPDAEEAWHLLRALALLGVTDLAARVPPIERHHEKLVDIARFLETGEVPQIAPSGLEELAKAREKALKKMQK